jgi:hypothetical protein
MTDYTDASHTGLPDETPSAAPSPVNPHFSGRDHSDMQELREIQDLMKTDIDAYFRNAEIPGRYAELLGRVGPPSAAVAVSDPEEAATLVDKDVPLSPEQFTIDDSKFARGSFQSGDRAAFDQAFNVAYSEGIGQQKFNWALGYLATRREFTPQAFAKSARENGWHPNQIDVAIDLCRRHKLFSGD